MNIETRTYSDGTTATGLAPLPDLSPAQQSYQPGPLRVELRASDRHGDQYAIENDTDVVRGPWKDAYVHFSGYFGSYGPHLFAAAPELLKWLTEVVKTLGPEQHELRDRARAVIAKAAPSVSHDYPACALFRGGKCTCDSSDKGGAA